MTRGAPTKRWAIRAARARSPAATSASTPCMFAFAPRYGSTQVQSRLHVSASAPAASSQNRRSSTSSACASSSRSRVRRREHDKDVVVAALVPRHPGLREPAAVLMVVEGAAQRGQPHAVSSSGCRLRRKAPWARACVQGIHSSAGALRPASRRCAATRSRRRGAANRARTSAACPARHQVSIICDELSRRPRSTGL